MAYLKSKFYPVDTTHRLIYNDPQRRERDCSFGYNFGTRYSVRDTATIGVKGEHLAVGRYQQYRILPPIPFALGAKVKVQPLNPDRDELMDCIGAVGVIIAYIPSRHITNGGYVWKVALFGERELFFRAEELHRFYGHES